MHQMMISQLQYWTELLTKSCRSSLYARLRVVNSMMWAPVSHYSRFCKVFRNLYLQYQVLYMNICWQPKDILFTRRGLNSGFSILTHLCFLSEGTKVAGWIFHLACSLEDTCLENWWSFAAHRMWPALHFSPPLLWCSQGDYQYELSWDKKEEYVMSQRLLDACVGSPTR